MLQVSINNVVDVFFMFLYILMLILLVFLFLGSAEADIGGGEKLNGHLLCQEYSHQKL